MTSENAVPAAAKSTLLGALGLGVVMVPVWIFNEIYTDVRNTEKRLTVLEARVASVESELRTATNAVLRRLDRMGARIDAQTHLPLTTHTDERGPR